MRVVVGQVGVRSGRLAVVDAGVVLLATALVLVGAVLAGGREGQRSPTGGAHRVHRLGCSQRVAWVWPRGAFEGGSRVAS
jgi:hypothetical protein